MPQWYRAIAVDGGHVHRHAKTREQKLDDFWFTHRHPQALTSPCDAQHSSILLNTSQRFPTANLQFSTPLSRCLKAAMPAKSTARTDC